jgi:hypothetical protein
MEMIRGVGWTRSARTVVVLIGERGAFDEA